MNKLNNRRLDRFILRYRMEQAVGQAVAEQRIYNELGRRLARRQRQEGSIAPLLMEKPPAPPVDQEGAFQDALALSVGL